VLAQYASKNLKIKIYRNIIKQLAASSQIPRDILNHTQGNDKMAELRDITNTRIPSENFCLTDVTGDSERMFRFCLMFLSVIWPHVMGGGGRKGKEDACLWIWITDLL
jgi:hypothetical protein